MNQHSFDRSLLAPQPFPHAIIRHALEESVADLALEWLTTKAPWSVQASSFYLQHGCQIPSESSASRYLSALIAPESITAMGDYLDRLFSTNINPEMITTTPPRFLPVH